MRHFAQPAEACRLYARSQRKAADAPTPAAMVAAIGVRHEPVALDAVRQRSADLAAMYAFLKDVERFWVTGSGAVAFVVKRAFAWRTARRALRHERIKMLGNFPFTLPHELAAGQRRQLRRLGEAA